MYFAVRNYLLTPAAWVLGCMLVANSLGVEWTWKVVVLAVWASVWGDILDAITEARPVSGPKRWSN